MKTETTPEIPDFATASPADLEAFATEWADSQGLRPLSELHALSQLGILRGCLSRRCSERDRLATDVKYLQAVADRKYENLPV